ncbi:unnamed protein product [Trichogramma brassicae]|uniref:RNA-directed DNA polymerase n=1 Tax=Trichogramma brassicae TaxID=86971 RepID=A0A6H5ILT2_9HYME|nr:unnamed protein product [Trichogramma brassicae]
MSGLRPKRCNGAGLQPLQLLVRPFGKRAGGGAGPVAAPLKSNTRPKESDCADDALIRWLYNLEQQGKLKIPTLGEVLAHCEWPRDDTLIPMPGGGTISKRCERPAGQAEEGIEEIVEPCETRKQDAWSQGEFVTLELGGEIEESARETQRKNRRRLCDNTSVSVPESGEVVAPCERPRGDFSTPKPRKGSLLDVTSKGRSRKTLRSVNTVESDRVSTLEERLSGEEFSRGRKGTLKPGEDCAGGTIPRNTSRTDPVSGGVTSKTAENAVCRSQTQSLVSGVYNSDEDIECLDSVYMATPETSMPDEQDGADSGPEEGVTVTTIADIHEPRESERRGPTRSIIYLDIAAMTRENRFFVDVRVGPFTYKASGAQCCLAGPRMMRELAERIKPSMSLIGYANQQTQPPGGYLPVMLQIDREAGRIDMECTEILPVEMVLGADFGRRWRVDISMGRNQWRSGDGPWHNFAKLNEARSMRCDIVAECAGITVCGGEREIIESKIKRLIPDVPPKLGHTDKIVHQIELVEGAKPVCHRTRRMTPKMEKIAHECLQKMKEEGIIEPAKSEWNSAPVLVKKSDGSYRFCVDYRDLNKVTKKDGYPCKNMDTILDRLRRARYISKIDLKSAYHQVCLDEDSVYKPLMDSLFGAEVEPYVFAYLDDIILVTETFEEHVSWLERVIRILLDAKLVVNRDKCEFCCQSVQFLGYVLDSSGLRIDSERVRPIHDYPTPRNVLLRKDTPFVWGSDQEQAFATLKPSLSEAPVLVRPDFDKEFAIQTDASDYAIGAVLTQEREDGEHSVYYISRVLTSAERNYTVTEKECLAVLWAIEKFRPYVEGYHFKVVTDHRALSWLRNFKDPQGRVARWALKLMEYDFEIVYRKGSLHYVPDALSRAFECDERSEFFAFERIEDEWYMKKLSEVKKSPSKYTNWCIEDGMLYKRSYNALLDPVSNAENSWRLVVPAEQRERVLTESHCLTSSGHLAAKKTYDRLACEYWWPGMWYAVEEYCNSCDVCQRYKVPQTGPKGLMTRRVVDRPWAVVAADMMEFPRSKNQNKYLLVFQDLFTRWIEIVPLRKANGMERNTNEEQRRSFSAVVRGATGRTAPSVRPAMDERAGASSSERNASEEARASQGAVAELNEYVRLMELGVPARLRPEPEGRAVVEVSSELIPVFARPLMHASEDAMDWEESVQPGNYSWQRPAWQQRTDADRRRDARQRRRANGVGTRQRTPSPGEGRRPNGGGEPLLEEDTRAMLEELVAARQPVEEWDGEAFEEVFRGSPEEEVALLEEGEATATLRRSGERTEGSARVPTPPLAPVIEPSALPLPPPVQQVSNVAGPHGLVFQPFAMQQQRLPQTEYPLDRQQQRQLRAPPGALPRAANNIVSYPRLQPQQHQREEVRVEVRPLSPVAGPSSLSGNARPHRLASEAKIFEAWSRRCLFNSRVYSRMLVTLVLSRIASAMLEQPTETLGRTMSPCGGIGSCHYSEFFFLRPCGDSLSGQNTKNGLQSRTSRQSAILLTPGKLLVQESSMSHCKDDSNTAVTKPFEIKLLSFVRTLEDLVNASSCIASFPVLWITSISDRPAPRQKVPLGT